MQAELILLLITLVSIIGTPGPNNTILFSSGLNYGYKGTLPLITAINLGATSAVAISAVGASYIITLLPKVEYYFTWLSLILLCYMAWLMWPRSIGKSTVESKKSVSTILLACIFFSLLILKYGWLLSVLLQHFTIA